MDFIDMKTIKSEHPAYLFNMSARDMARFGQLYVQKGKWHSDQIISEQWIDQSTAKISTDLGRFANREGYGYLWWVTDDYFGHRMFYASGSGGHRIMVFPEDNIVIITRVNTYEGRNVSQQTIGEIVKTLFQHKTGEAKENAVLINYKPKVELPEPITLTKDKLKLYTGDYQHPFLGIFSITTENEEIILKTNIGAFRLIPIGENLLYPVDLETSIEMRTAPDDDTRNKIQPVFNEQRQLLKAIFYY